MRIRFAGIVVILAMLAACDSGGRASPSSGSPRSSSPLTTASATPTRTGPLTTGAGVLPGEKPPVLSDAAKRHTPAGALLFANYYFDAFDWSVATTDPFLVKQVSTPTCSGCNRAIDGLATLDKQGATLRGGRIHVVSAKIVTGAFRIKSDYVVQVTLKQDAEVISRPSAAPSTVAPVPNDVSLVFVSWAAHGWRIEEVGAPS